MKTPQDRWKLYDRFLIVLGTLLIPATIWWVTSGAEREKLRLEYVRIAAAILYQRREEPDSQRIMREWAVAVLNRSSPVTLSKQQADALVDGTSKLAPYGVDDWVYPGPWVYDDDVDPHAAKKPPASQKPR
jgi:hypothetical protein